ncbi:MAG: S-layer homology domain-containing protein, partial [Candidatus Gracilibacteria bacterium]|nr:S-layer homology domain-containing protein [Candidatus Gracilibacteria bacterium]
YDDLNVEYWRTRLAGIREIQVAGRKKVPVDLVPEEELDITPPAWEESLPPSEEADTRITDIIVAEDENIVAAEVAENVSEVSAAELDEVEEVAVADFPDVPPTHPRYDEIIYLKQEGIVNGYADGTFRPTGRITRAELLKIVMGARGLTPSGESDLSDVQDHWVESYVATAKKLGIVGGYPDGTFKPNNEVTLVESLKIILNTLNVNVPDEAPELPFTNVATSEWYAPYLYVVYRDHLLDLPGDTVNPDTKILRQDVATMIYRIGQE